MYIVLWAPDKKDLSDTQYLATCRTLKKARQVIKQDIKSLKDTYLAEDWARNRYMIAKVTKYN